MAGIAGNDVADAPKNVSVGNGMTAPITENLQQALGGTVGGASYPFRIALPPVTFAPSTNYQSRATDPGTLLSIIDLDNLAYDPMIEELKSRFISYYYKDLTLVLKCASPFSTASGTVELAYNPDPENRLNSTDPAQALLQVMRLTESQQISAKTDAVIQIPDSQLADPIFGNKKRYCKKAVSPSPRFERYGQIAVVMRTEPAAGDGSQWAITLMGSAEFSGPTMNNVASTVRYPISISMDDQDGLDLVPFKGGYTLQLQLKDGGRDLPEAVGNILFSPPIDIIFKVGDANDSSLDPEEYRQQYTTAQFSREKDDNLYIYFPTLMGKVTSFSHPEPTEIIANDTSANLVYNVDQESYRLASGELVTPTSLMYMPVSKAPQSFVTRAALSHQYGLQPQHTSGAKVFTWLRDRFL